MSDELEYPRRIPGVLVPQQTGSGRTTRDWVVDGLCFVLGVLIGILVVGSTHADHDFPGWFIALDLVSGTAACVALWWRRRWPLGLALTLAVVGTYSSAAGGAAVIALFTLAVHWPFRVVAPVVALAIA